MATRARADGGALTRSALRQSSGVQNPWVCSRLVGGAVRLGGQIPTEAELLQPADLFSLALPHGSEVVLDGR